VTFFFRKSLLDKYIERSRAGLGEGFSRQATDLRRTILPVDRPKSLLRLPKLPIPSWEGFGPKAIGTVQTWEAWKNRNFMPPVPVVDSEFNAARLTITNPSHV